MNEPLPSAARANELTSARATPRVLIGSSLFLAGQALSTLVFAILGLLVAPLSYHTRYAVITTWTRFNLWWLAQCCGLRHEVRGLEHVPASASIVLCKHESAWETLALQTVFRPQSWVLKKELLRVPFFGWGLALLRPIAIDRSQGKRAIRDLIEQGSERLADGIWVVVFPEGTRVAPGTVGRYQKGGAVLSKHSGHLAVPVAHNAGDYWRRNSFLKFPGTITMVIGPPLDPEAYTAEEINERSKELIESTVASLRGATDLGT